MQHPHGAQLHAEPVALEDDFASAVIGGLSRPQKALPCRYFYDARGSELFEEITHLPEYYPTRTEMGILNAHAGEMTESLPNAGVLVEFGSGSSRKTEILLRQLPRLSAYVMIDVSQTALDGAKARLAEHFPELDVRAIVGDFSFPVALPADLQPRPKTGFFPGSTIGNLTPADAERLLRIFRVALAPAGRLIIGADLKKDARTLVLAYDDPAGVTAAFNLNLLARINRELGADFDLAAFQHEAIYNPRHGRIEMYLVSRTQQQVTVGEHRFTFRPGETIHTENSYKYTIDQFRELARAADWLPRRVWTDEDNMFSVHELIAG
ncbi:MAG TPA: L-histidine N(alpha)-methyltransferase [Hyphomicrobiaceae bacterium]|nr:L-histidine N(alpha)-methyltransferase [Hyphomicrobiaceae bacterium]